MHVLCSFLQDVGGEEKLRPYWRHYYTGTQGILFVVDATDRERLPLAALELRTLANDEQLTEAVIAVAVNKTEAPGAMSLQDVQRGMDLQTYVPSRVAIFRIPLVLPGPA
jgi:GTPase SAR1 family protein